jgi:glycosyltransferase involved in cell wall biosynthesis
MPIRLLFLNTRDDVGADVAVHLTLMKHFAANEVEVFVMSNSEATEADLMQAQLAQLPQVTAKFVPLGKPAAKLAGRNKLSKALAYGPSLASLARIAAFVRKNRIQVIHATDRPRDASYASLLGHLTGAKTVVHMHAPPSELTRPTMWGMRNATAIFAVSEFIRRGLISMGLQADKIFTIHNAVDADHFDPDQQADNQPTIRERFSIPQNARLIGIAARMNPWKGQYELIGALSSLREKHPDLHLMILGANVPEFRAEYEKRAREGGVADRIHFGGFQKDIRPFLHEFDLFALPSYGEPFGLAIVEAMSMRIPTLACNTGGVPEIITHGSDGWLVEERSADAVAAGLAVLLDDATLCRRLGDRGRETARTRFTPQIQAAAVTRRYQSLVQAK